MREAAKNLEFEKAGRVRDQLRGAPDDHRGTGVRLGRALDRDAIGLHREGERVALQWLPFREGRLEAGRVHIFSTELPDSEVLGSFLTNFIAATRSCRARSSSRTSRTIATRSRSGSRRSATGLWSWRSRKVGMRNARSQWLSRTRRSRSPRAKAWRPRPKNLWNDCAIALVSRSARPRSIASTSRLCRGAPRWPRESASSRGFPTKTPIAATRSRGSPVRTISPRWPRSSGARSAATSRSRRSPISWSSTAGAASSTPRSARARTRGVRGRHGRARQGSRHVERRGIPT